MKCNKDYHYRGGNLLSFAFEELEIDSCHLSPICAILLSWLIVRNVRNVFFLRRTLLVAHIHQLSIVEQQHIRNGD